MKSPSEWPQHAKPPVETSTSFSNSIVDFLGPVLTAASAHLDAAIPNFVVQEYSMIDEGPSAAAYTSSLQREGGYLLLPEQPGLGVRVDRNTDLWLSPYITPLHETPLRADGSVAYSV